VKTANSAPEKEFTEEGIFNLYARSENGVTS